MEILDQIPSLAVIIQFVTDGFLLGALAGAVIGSSVWTLMERGTHSVLPLMIAGIIGIFVGFFLEGDTIRTLANRDWTTFFSGPVSFRSAVFEAIIQIVGWSFVTMIFGAAISNYKLAFWGFIIGGVMGTLSGILMQVVASELNFPLASPITPVIVVIIAVILIVLAAAGREKEIR